MKLYFVRHAQSMGNLTADYSTLAHDQLSPLGKEQAKNLARRLSNGYRFDAIYASPSLRALETIVPYLKETNRQADVWVELDEGCWQTGKDQELPPRKNPKPGRPITLAEDITPYFVLGEPPNMFPPENENYQEGLNRIRKARENILQRHGGTHNSILIIGHGCAVSRLFDMLLGAAPSGYMRYEMSNTGLACLNEHASGSMFMEFFNRLD